MPETKVPNFNAGQVVMFDRKGKRSLAVKILEIIKEDGDYFYRIDRKNCVSESMVREQTNEEKGIDISPQHPLRAAKARSEDE